MRRDAEFDLSTRQRLIAFADSGLSAEQVLTMPVEEFTYDLMKQYKVSALNITTASVGPATLKRLGFEGCEQMRDLGFDALSLADPKFAEEAVSSFGSEDVKSVFLSSPSDAVAISGSDAMTIVGITVEDMLKQCAGAPVEAFAVLQQLPLGQALRGCAASVVLDTCLRRESLLKLGYGLAKTAEHTGASAGELSKLGF